MWHSRETFMRAAHRAAALFDEWASPLMPYATADHLCYRCESSLEFDEIRRCFETPDGFVYQSFISRRRIAVIKFAPAIPTVLGPISFLELSDQKPDGSQKSGFDHIEIYPSAGTVVELVEAFSKKHVIFAKAERPHHVTYDTKIAGSSFKIRIEPEPLIEKIRETEM